MIDGSDDEAGIGERLDRVVMAMPRGGSIRWPPSEVSSGPGQVRRSGPERD